VWLRNLNLERWSQRARLPLPGKPLSPAGRYRSFWHYEFVLNRKRYHKSTKMKNEREALKVASAAFTALVKGEAGIGEPKSVPTLKAFREDFVTAIRAEKQGQAENCAVLHLFV
jgi:hypothetical protein